MIRSAVFLLVCAWLAVPAWAQSPSPPERSAPPNAASETEALPANNVTHQTLELPGRTLHFAATAGSIRLYDDKNAPQADVAFIAYQADGAEPTTRPVTFVFNGGPGMASGWLQVGAVGPWRLRLGADAPIPSAQPDPVPNPETWLDFTDLVFIDPPGTGYSRIIAAGEDARRRFWSVEGDISALAEVIRRWLDRNDRNVSPKFILGESYGGFRAPRVARELQSQQGTGVAGLVLLSPALDLAVLAHPLDPLRWVIELPSQTAAARAAKGPVTRDALADVEQYARSDFIVDILRGTHDAAAVARVSQRVAAFTGIDPAIVSRYQGRLDTGVFLHELDRAQGRVASAYDATVTSADPFPNMTMSEYADPLFEGMQASITSAMATIYADKLHWHPGSVYHLSSQAVFRQWDWGRGQQRPNSIWHLQSALALDPRMHVLVAHGMFDLVTPYFATALALDQLPAFITPDRVRLEVYPGGHMFYTEDASRAALRDAAKALYVPH
jgi:carboxypeptidase C (cathepsin A)